MYVSNHIDGVMGKKKKQTGILYSLSISAFSFELFFLFFLGNGKWSFGGCFLHLFCFVCIVVLYPIFGKMIRESDEMISD